VGEGGPGGDSAPTTEAGIVDARTKDAGKSAIDGGPETGSDAMVSGKDSSPFTGFGDGSGGFPADPDGGSMLPPDASKPDAGGSSVCAQSLGWWLVGATLDTTVVPATAASQLTPLLSSQHPITIADYSDASAGRVVLVSGTLTNGIGQQYFPFTYPTSPATLSLSADADPVFTATPPSAGWIHVVDASASDVWISLSNPSFTATATDSQCQGLTSGQLSAVIPASAGTTSLVVSSGSTTIAELFGIETSSSPAGWNLALTFTAQKVQVTLK
jgi:hypothetical protein